MDTVALGWCHYLFVFNLIHLLTRGFLGDSMVKKSICNAKDTRYAGSIPGLGRSPGVGNGNLLRYSCLGNSKDREAWWACGCWGQGPPL